jgi:hypothetical protein
MANVLYKQYICFEKHSGTMAMSRFQRSNGPPCCPGSSEHCIERLLSYLVENFWFYRVFMGGWTMGNQTNTGNKRSLSIHQTIEV